MKNPERDSDIARRFDAGEELSVMAEEYGITQARVSQIAHKKGCAKRRVFHRLACRSPGSNSPVIVRRTVRATAIVNHGKFSAAKIARTIGVSRNTIIGHWFRARRQGIIHVTP